jgi:formate hydrogenlyase transcriptional activator
MPTQRPILAGDPPLTLSPLETGAPESPYVGRHGRPVESGPQPGYPTTSRRFAFQRLVADLAARFAVTEASDVDRAVEHSLRDIGEALETDCIELWQFDPAAAGFVVTHRWANGGLAPAAGGWPTARIPHTASKLLNGQAVWFTGEGGPGAIDRETFRQAGLRSAAAVPLGAAGRAEHVRRSMMCGSTDAQRDWPTAVVQQLRLTAGIFSQALLRKASQAELQIALSELQQLRDRAAEDDLRRPILSPERPPRRIVAGSPAMADVLEQIKQVAPTPATVLLLGETGVGKEVLAEAIHEMSPRRQRQMVSVNCAAMPTALIESALFGHERGAFTDAIARQIGRFEAANHSTLFLDEIGDLPGYIQVKLLRVLQERVFERLGSSQSVKVDVRIIAATNRNLEQAVADGAFREDLYYRLNVFPVTIPPLRERKADIPGLVWEFVDEFSQAFGKPIDSVSKESMQQLQEHPWPGNVRELRNIIERAAIVSTGPRLVPSVPSRVGSRESVVSSR